VNLFKVIPYNFFTVLSSPLKNIYSDIIFLIYQQHLLINFGLKREITIDVITSYLEDQVQDENFTRALDDEIWDESMDALSEVKDRANFILRKLEKTGWLTIETYSNYEQYVNLTDHAIKIIDILDKIKENYQAEYQGYVYATYTLLYSNEAERQRHIALEKVYEQTEELIRGLKSLHHNIKRFIERVLNEKKPQDILKLHFYDYKQEIIDKSYHRLKTSDNVSKYRPMIISKIDEWYNNEDVVLDISMAEVKRDRYSDLDKAKEATYARLDFVRQAYLNLDQLLEEIDRKNTRYANASFMQLKYILNSNKNTEGQLLEILKYGAGLLKEEYRKDDTLPEELEKLFTLYSQDFIETESLYKPRQLSKDHNPEELQNLGMIEDKLREKRIMELQEHLAQKMTRKKINEFVLKRLGVRNHIRASEMGVNDIEDFIRLIYIAAYSRSKQVDYSVDFIGERIRSEEGSFEFKDILIKKRGYV
jgi:hypothetical protein